MTMIAEVAIPVQMKATPLPCAPEIAPQRRHQYSIERRVFGFVLLAGLVAFNFWWYRRASHPLEDYDKISTWIQSNRHAAAKGALYERLRRSNRDSQARIMLARVLAAGNDFLGCARELHDVPFWSSEKPEALFREAQAYLSINRARDAEQALLEVLKDDPLHPISLALYHDAAQELLKIYAVEDRWEDAYAIMWRSYDHALPIDHPTILSMRMRAELDRVSYKEASSVLLQYVAAQPDDWEAFRALARAGAALGQHGDAIRYFQVCLKARPDDVRTWRDYLAMLLEQGDLEAFLDLLKRPPVGADAESETWMYRGIAGERDGIWAVAAQHFRKAIELNPAVPKYYYRLAMAEERLGLHNEAIAHRQRTHEMNDARAQLSAAYGAFFGSQGSLQPSRAEQETARKKLASICETLGWSRAAEAWSRLILPE